MIRLGLDFEIRFINEDIKWEHTGGRSQPYNLTLVYLKKQLYDCVENYTTSRWSDYINYYRWMGGWVGGPGVDPWWVVWSETATTIMSHPSILLGPSLPACLLCFPLPLSSILYEVPSLFQFVIFADFDMPKNYAVVHGVAPTAYPTPAPTSVPTMVPTQSPTPDTWHSINATTNFGG